MALWGVPLLLAMLGGVLAGVLLGGAVERWLYQPMAARLGSGSPFTIFVASLGVTIVVENTINLLWGGGGLTFNNLSETAIRVGSVTFTNLDVIVVALAWVLVAGLHIMLRKTRAGRIITAVRVNPEMARVVGIRPRNVYIWVFVIGSALGGVAALYETAAFAATPSMGTDPLFDGFLVVFLAGYARGPIFLMATGVGLGLVQNLSQLWLAAQWAPVVVFSVLIVYLVGRAIGVDRIYRSLHLSRAARV
jgi:branched-chain amino acid transport system permease protein